jgi:hypothetical protein
MFFNRGYAIAGSIEESDIVVWTGGQDINPKLYGEEASGAHFWSDSRDRDDVDAIYRSEDKFKIGVCRGAQLLNCIPNGGKLWQDVDRHGSSHTVEDVITGETIRVNSLHHQQLRLTDKAELVAYCNVSSYKESEKDSWHVGLGTKDVDVEVAWYPDTKSLCFQAHPEFAIGESTEQYFFDLIDRYFLAA